MIPVKIGHFKFFKDEYLRKLKLVNSSFISKERPETELGIQFNISFWASGSTSLSNCGSATSIDIKFIYEFSLERNLAPSL